MRLISSSKKSRKGLNIWNDGKSRRGWCEEGVHGRENAASSHLARRGLRKLAQRDINEMRGTLRFETSVRASLAEQGVGGRNKHFIVGISNRW